MRSHFKHLEQSLGYQFIDTQLLNRALTHRSYSADHNERLEFLGDSILSFIIAQVLYQKFPNTREGDLSRMRSSLVRGESLAKLAKDMHFGDFLNLGSGELKSGGFRRESILEDTMEAVIGAIYLDCKNMSICEGLILNWFKKQLETINPKTSIKDSKTQLQEYLQSKHLPLPDYEVTEIRGQAHNQQFTVECRIAHIQPISAAGSSRRKAEQKAAAAALEYIKEHPFALKK